MKKFQLLIIFLVLAHGVCLAQESCRLSNPVFRFAPGQKSVVVRSLGNSPEFKCLAGKKSKISFYNSLITFKTCAKSRADIKELDGLLNDIGFEGGLASPALTIDKIDSVALPYGITGNLGYKTKKGIGYQYSNLNIKAGIQAWRIRAVSGCFFYILYRCGNAFYPDKKDTCCFIKKIHAHSDTVAIPVVTQRQIITKYYKVTIFRNCIPARNNDTTLLYSCSSTKITIDYRYEYFDKVDSNKSICKKDTLDIYAKLKQTVHTIPTRVNTDTVETVISLPIRIVCVKNATLATKNSK